MLGSIHPACRYNSRWQMPAKFSRDDLMSFTWMGLMAIVGFVVWVKVYHPLGPSDAQQQAIVEANAALDDAQAIIERYGAPEADTIVSPGSPGGDAAGVAAKVRVLTFRARNLRIILTERPAAGGKPIWKLTGFLDVSKDTVVDGDEALKRLTAAVPAPK
jgi:hypothetical protein